MKRPPAVVELKLTPTLAIVPIVRRFVESFFERTIGHADAASRLALAAHELLENVAKFSLDGAAMVRLAAEPVTGGTRITLRTVNRASESDRQNIVQALDELAESPDVFEHYQALMRETARRRAGSGLGLARVWVECEMRLSYLVTGDEVELDAVAVLDDSLRRPRLSGVKTADFTSDVSFDGGVLLVTMKGSADASAGAAIESLLPRIHEEVLRLGLDEVVVDITSLELMTSSCFKSFVTWITDVADLMPERQYRIRLRGTPGILWQRRSLHALKRFGDALVQIEGWL